MNQMKKAIATIETEIGTMTIYFNGAREEMTAEKGDTVEEIGCKPTSEDDAVDAIYAMYKLPCWGLKWIEEVGE